LVIKVASYNIRKAVGNDRQRRPNRILDVISEINADIIALQESDRRFGTRHAALPRELLTHPERYRAVPFITGMHSIGWHGNAILVDNQIDVLRHSAIAIPMLEPRGAVSADLVVAGEAIRVVAMHLDLSGLMRRRQVRAILADLANRDEQLPTILMGDLNEWSRSGGCLHEFAADFHIAPTLPSFHALRPIARLDRIIVSSGIVIRDSGTHHSLMARRASDHLPVWAELVI
jgi:endonuclease/exonuclease/phosphatase family metal-dependent hydrolase